MNSEEYFDDFCLKIFDKKTYIKIYYDITNLIHNISSGFTINDNDDTNNKSYFYNNSEFTDISHEYVEDNNININIPKNEIVYEQPKNRKNSYNDWEFI